jgi:hypothetical protein
MHTPMRVRKLIKVAARFLLLLIWRPLQHLKEFPWWADILTVICFFLVLYELLYDAVPNIQPDPAISTSWRDLPLTARIDSRLFGANKVEVFCLWENISWKMSDDYMFTMRFDKFFGIEDAENVIPARGAIAIKCRVSDQISLGHTTGVIREAKDIALIKLKVKIAYYSAFWPVRREVISPTFTWRAVSGGFQWLEGDASKLP